MILEYDEIPHLCHIELTYACNQNCIFCYNPGEVPYGMPDQYLSLFTGKGDRYFIMVLSIHTYTQARLVFVRLRRKIHERFGRKIIMLLPAAYIGG